MEKREGWAKNVIGTKLDAQLSLNEAIVETSHKRSSLKATASNLCSFRYSMRFI